MFDSNIGEISKLPDTSSRSPVLPCNRITGTFDLLSGTVNFLAAVIIIPLYEELLYRGLALKAYEKASSPLFAAVFTAILFSLFHLNFVQIIWLLPISFITARAVQVSGSWWIAAIFHAVHNGLIFVLTSLTPVNGGTTENPISFWIGLVGLVLAIVAFGVAIFWFRKREQRLLILERKKEKIFTPSLTIFITVCFLLMFS